jgi:hypothetical protein
MSRAQLKSSLTDDHARRIARAIAKGKPPPDQGGRHVNDHVDPAGVDPPAHDIRPDVWLVLMIGADDLNLHALGGGAEILNCHARRDQRAPAAQVGIGARHVVQDPDRRSCLWR